MQGQAWRSPKVRRPRDAVAPLIEALREALYDDNVGVAFELHFCGSWRRGCEYVGDVDVVVLSRSEFVPNLFEPGIRLPELPGMHYDRRGRRIGAATVLMPDGLPLNCDFFCFPYESAGCALLAYTGPSAYSKWTRVQAARCRPSLALSQQALKVRETGEVLDVPDERAVVERIGLRYETPAERQRWAEPC